MPITEAQLVLLRAALLREDGLLPRPERLAGAALSRIEAALTDTGMAEVMPVQPGNPRWREIEGMPIGLHITDSGRAAAGVPQMSVAESTESDDHLPADDGSRSAQEPGGRTTAEPMTLRPPRPGSKAARLVSMLSGAEGTTIDAISAALSWQPHTVRAALTRLRQRGLVLTGCKDAGQPTTYRIAPVSQNPSAAADGEAML